MNERELWQRLRGHLNPHAMVGAGGNPLPLVCRGVRTDSGRVPLDLYCPRCGCQSHRQEDCPFVVYGGALVKGGGR